MVFPLGTVLAAAPGIIAGAAEMLKMVKSLKSGDSGSNARTIKEIEDLLEKQTIAIHDMAESNRNLALAVRTNRIIAGVSLPIAVVTLVFVLLE